MKFAHPAPSFRFRLALRWKLILAIGLPIVTIYTVVLIIFFYQSRDAAYRHIEAYLQQLVFHQAERMNGEFSSLAQVAKSTADVLTVDPALDEKALYKLAERNVAQNPRVYGSCIAFEPYAFDVKRRLVAPYVWRGKSDLAKPASTGFLEMDVARDAYDYLDWEWYRDPKKRNQSLWTEPFFDEGAGDVIMVTHSAPFYRDGQFRGVATVDVHLEKLQEWMEFESDRASFAILSREGKFLSHPNPQNIMNHTIYSLARQENRADIEQFGKIILAEGVGVAKVKNFPAEEDSFVVYAPIRSTGWIFIAAVPESKIMAPVWKQLLGSSIFMLACLVVIVVILLAVSFAVTNPLRKLTSELRRMASGDLEIKKNGNYPRDEIGNLFSTFHWMVGELRSHIEALTLETAARGALESELRIARDIQSSLIPQKFPPFPSIRNFELHALNVPARHVAGDFFDYFLLSEEDLVVVIGDVSGKGISAAMFMAITQTLLRNLAHGPANLSGVVSQVNRELLRDNRRGFFVSLVLMRYGIKTGKISYTIAGHPLPYVVDGAGNLRTFGSTTGPVVGLIDDAIFESGEGWLQPGETVVLYTDGVSEARNPGREFWGDERFEKALKENAAAGARGLCENVFHRVSEFQGQAFSDDVTILALKRSF